MVGGKTKIKALEQLPGDFDLLAGEVAAGLARLYGPAAGRAYLGAAQQALRNQMRHPACLVLGAEVGGALAALLTGGLRGGMAEISFLHVREAFLGRGIETALAREAVNTYRAGGADGIICETVSLCPLELGPYMSAEGFTHVPRALMRAESNTVAGDAGPYQVEAVKERDWPEAAACIVDAYREHPGRRLHYEVRGILQSADFVSRVASGRYGPVIDGGLWGVRGVHGWDGVLAGCSIAPGVGFVLQVGVRREKQGKGIGTALLRHAARRFDESALPRVVLGVTADDPAQRLYEKLGFSVIRPVDAYIWWRPGHAAAAGEAD